MNMSPRLPVKLCCCLCALLLVGVCVGRWVPPTARSQSARVPRAHLPLVLKGMAQDESADPKPTRVPGPTPTSPPTPPPASAIRNGDFEQGALGWTQQSTEGYAAIVRRAPVATHSGAWLAWLGGAADDASSVGQRLVLPPDQRFLTYWAWISSTDVCGYDNAAVTVSYDDLSEQIEEYWLCDSTNTNGWVRHVVDLGPFAGRTVEIAIGATVDGSINSNLFVDDIALVPSAP